VFIRADAAASVQDLATVMDKLKEAGVEKVGWMTKPAGR
jgi:biopolymer transport protein ExbD